VSGPLRILFFAVKFPWLFIAANKLTFIADSSEILVGEFEFISDSVLTVYWR